MLNKASIDYVCFGNHGHKFVVAPAALVRRTQHYNGTWLKAIVVVAA